MQDNSSNLAQQASQDRANAAMLQAAVLQVVLQAGGAYEE
jgi:hypothetical protein